MDALYCPRGTEIARNEQKLWDSKSTPPFYGPSTRLALKASLAILFHVLCLLSTADYSGEKVVHDSDQGGYEVFFSMIWGHISKKVLNLIKCG